MTVRAETTLMFAEAAMAGAAIRALLMSNRLRIERLAGALRDSPPPAVITCARGSSDNAATYARYLIETRLGILTGSLGLSVASLYEAPLRLSNGLCLAISQSGASPDLRAAVSLARRAGALTVAVVNAPDAPVGGDADETIALSAGTERSVAATKSFVASMAAIAWLVAAWAEEIDMLAAIEQLPGQLDAAWTLDWSPVVAALRSATSTFVLGRGPGLAIAQEAALKLKETSALHAEALSVAEVEHGPMALVERNFPVLIFAQDDETRAPTMALAKRFVDRGARVFMAGDTVDGAVALPTLPCHPALAPILQIQSFYRCAAELSVERGRDPDNPPHLHKVTKTL